MPRSRTHCAAPAGQFIDHDVVATVDEEDGESHDIILSSFGQTATMTLHRLFTEPEAGNPKCRSPINVISPQIDASQIYGSDPVYLKNVLREPASCRLRTSPGELLPVTTDKDVAGQNRFIAGDGRVNEHGILTAMHTVWMREHNRLCEIANGKPEYESASWDEKFEAIRKARCSSWPALLLVLLSDAPTLCMQCEHAHLPSACAWGAVAHSCALRCVNRSCDTTLATCA